MFYSKKLSLVLIGGQEDYECFSIIVYEQLLIINFTTHLYIIFNFKKGNRDQKDILYINKKDG